MKKFKSTDLKYMVEKYTEPKKVNVYLLLVLIGIIIIGFVGR